MMMTVIMMIFSLWGTPNVHGKAMLVARTEAVSLPNEKKKKNEGTQRQKKDKVKERFFSRTNQGY